jgi:hypothetical protein
MYPRILSKVEVWDIENVIFKLYQSIQVFERRIGLTSPDCSAVSLPTDWRTYDITIAAYFETPTKYDFGRDIYITLDYEKIKSLRNYIIDSEVLYLAIELTSPHLYLHNLIETINSESRKIGEKAKSIEYLGMIKDFRKEIMKWAIVYSYRIGFDLKSEMQRHIEDPFLHSLHVFEYNVARTHARYTETCTYGSRNRISNLDLASLYKKDYDRSKVDRICQYINMLAREKMESYVSRIVSIIAYSHYNHYLRCTYSEAVRSILEHLNIEVKQCHLHPCSFGKPTEKGRFRKTYITAIQFFKSMEEDNRYPLAPGKI